MLIFFEYTDVCVVFNIYFVAFSMEDTHLTAIFHNSPSKVPACLHSEFYCSYLMEVVMTTGAIKCAELQWNCHHQQNNTQVFTGRMLCLSPVSEMTYTVSSGTLNSTISYHTIPTIFQSCLWSLKAPGYLREGCWASRQPFDASTSLPQWKNYFKITKFICLGTMLLLLQIFSTPCLSTKILLTVVAMRTLTMVIIPRKEKNVRCWLHPQIITRLVKQMWLVHQCRRCIPVWWHLATTSLLCLVDAHARVSGLAHTY